MSAPGNMREFMPATAAWIDDLRSAFGAEAINSSIKSGMNGLPTFWASENGHEVGTRDTRPQNYVDAAQMVITPKPKKKEPHANRNARHR